MAEASEASAAVPKAVPKGPPSFATRKALEDASEVKDGWLFLSGQLAASSLDCLQRLGISHVMNCCERIPCKFKGRLKYKVIPVMDTKSSDIRVYIPDAVAFIDEVLAAKGKVLVHCMVGASRSVSLVLAWLVAQCKLPLKQAFQLVRSGWVRIKELHDVPPGSVPEIQNNHERGRCTPGNEGLKLPQLLEVGHWKYDADFAQVHCCHESAFELCNQVTYK